MNNVNSHSIAALYTAKQQNVVINTYFKESYYKNETPLKESSLNIKKRIEFWQFMNNVSMQNVVVQMKKAA